MTDLKISIIIPVKNEKEALEELLPALQKFRKAGHEVIVVDGGSTDASLIIAAKLSDRAINAPAGRARQMNAGASHANNEIFWFLHADTSVPEKADEYILEALSARNGHWGRFNVRLSGQGFIYRIIERFMNLRSSLTGIATGDQGIFITRKLFSEVGGYVDIPLMEDISLCKKLLKKNKPMCLSTPIVTSSRRWEEKGAIKTVLHMWCFRIAYFFGASPHKLAKRYYPD